MVFRFLSDKIISSDWAAEKEVFITLCTDMISRASAHSMPRCNREEPDNKSVIHLKDALDKGCSTCLVQTVGTNVVVRYHINWKVPFPDKPTSDGSSLGSL